MQGLFQRKSLSTAALALALVAATLALQSDGKKTVEAIRLNNLGVAYLNQRRSEMALKDFEQAWA